MQLSTHFTLAEFTASDTATRLRIDNTLPPGLIQRAVDTANMMERIRAFLSAKAGRDIPVITSSAYRCQRLNRAIGSSDTSDHPRMLAVDWRAPAFGSPYDVCMALKDAVDELQIGQLINEFEAWVHTSTRTPSKPINRVITISHVGACAGIQRV